ncbi:ATP-dependent DNA helicase [Microbacterium amylolyticum]|uniref:DNA 3'-5' helicase n=1 Tax=Microbacterium amylolyticum TaxID=936337 RepID=A0ABS4ZKN7_9MICO|nr:ATP-dependent DNA helicase [Microbacterium amylolyticum]MBP2437777.1 DNA helicase-2/ATP-dependent DNA helicase PcrA [Microbacterium amylolyticum]
MSWGTGHGISAETIAAAIGQHTPTPAQRSVIEAPPSPALVVAGAGSGKTETMSARVVWLVANGHVRRDEILGLTFTRKAAGELAERIGKRLEQIDEFGRRGLLPHLNHIVASGALARIAAASDGAQRQAVRRDVLDELADHYATGWVPGTVASAEELLNRPRVSTYNAFADTLVRENAARIGRDPDATMLSSSASWVLARQVLLRADIDGLEDVDQSLGGLVEHVQSLAGDILDHRADPDEVRRYALRQAGEFADFVDPDVASTRDWEAAYEALSTLPLLLDLVDAYAEEKQRRGVLDFADQVSGALDVIERAPDVAHQVRAEFRVVLLDEYQDTSVLQTRLLSALFRGTAVMAVGDPNQSIYGWRGASADNLHAFAADFAGGVPAARFDLMTSWRNHRVVLRAANALLAPFRTSRGFDVKPLEPSPIAGEGHVEVRFPDTLDEEAETVAAWMESCRGRHEGAEPHTGALLFRSKKHMRVFSDALTRRGIPNRILGLGGLLSAAEVLDVVSAMRVLHDPSQGSALIRLLVGPRFSIGVADMAALYDLAIDLSQRDGALVPLPDEVRDRVRQSAGADEKASIIDALEFLRTARDDYRLLERFTEQGRERLREAGATFDRLRRAAGQPVPDLIRLIETELRLDIELSANETRGPQRTATAQLRAFTDEVRGFLQVDERGTIGSVLAWLDYAERSDDMMPRSEPPEPGVVQLLTMHGSKGLEWDSVAVVRLLDGELPGPSRGRLGGFGLGKLPYPFRGDVRALPVFEWVAPASIADAKQLRAETKQLRAAFADFAAANREHQLAEERRLAYVAVTRARGELLLTGSHWAGQKKPKKPSDFLIEIMEELGLGLIEEPADDATNPYEGAGVTVEWPLDPLGDRGPRVRAAAEAVRAAAPAEPSGQLALLLAERAEREREIPATIPTRIPASKFKDYVTDFAGTSAELLRPMPEKPFRQTRLGTLFHQWVEQRSGLVGQAATPDDPLWEIDEDLDERRGEASAQDESDLQRLREIFEASEWGGLSPRAVETEVNFAMPALDGGTPHLIICKLDAVFERDDRGGRIEIVDWKTGRAPKTDTEREDRMLQLALYRLAYHRQHGVPLEDIDVALFYVPDNLVLRDDRVVTEDELVERWHAARAR